MRSRPRLASIRSRPAPFVRRRSPWPCISSRENRPLRKAIACGLASKLPDISKFANPRVPESLFPNHDAKSLKSSDLAVAWPVTLKLCAVAARPESANVRDGEEKLRSMGEPSSESRRRDLRKRVKLIGSLFH